MDKKLIRKLCYVLAPVILLSFCIFSSIQKVPTNFNNNTISFKNIFTYSNIYNTLNREQIQSNVKLLGLFDVKSVSSSKVDGIELYPGGSCIGVKINTIGILVVGFSDIETLEGKVESPSKRAGIELGDIILKVNEEEIESSRDLIRKLNSAKKSSLDIVIDRNGEKINKTIEGVKATNDDKYKIGLWVRDSTAGVGTLTFYDGKTNKFGALGHPITDYDTNTILKIKEGKIVDTSVISVRKGQKGTPGELKGVFIEEDKPIGNIVNNTICGIFGTSDKSIVNKPINRPLKVGLRHELKEGKAQIITTVDENGPSLYNIEIVKLLPQEKPGPKSMIIKVTDSRLLSKTGGIVQGMSGSPIIQNDKIVGAVTHVLINKPDLGYGIYIEWMLKDANIIN
ncbi:SpoIVB peptidase [Clostridium polyendosporum]|uniref:SpoIVB peptidase n=1 Tax=Clostridium polyendosporum TaxID=69208 RepID=A0A919RX15_9CLOT|nr:SpoIVB peptidase [Clostridium polyendosporum]GIM27936.1 SpoIVB peptidase [Clostridium polyendosporum]